jgi:wobble nucleotide-excising tRNase
LDERVPIVEGVLGEDNETSYNHVLRIHDEVAGNILRRAGRSVSSSKDHADDEVSLDAQKLASKMLGAPAWATKLESLVKTQHAEAQTKMKSMETKMKSMEKTVKTVKTGNSTIQALMEKMVFFASYCMGTLIIA